MVFDTAAFQNTHKINEGSWSTTHKIATTACSALQCKPIPSTESEECHTHDWPIAVLQHHAILAAIAAVASAATGILAATVLTIGERRSVQHGVEAFVSVAIGQPQRTRRAPHPSSVVAS